MWGSKDPGKPTNPPSLTVTEVTESEDCSSAGSDLDEKGNKKLRRISRLHIHAQEAKVRTQCGPHISNDMC